jgi:hypothetical protein
MISHPDPMFGPDIEDGYRAVYRHITQTAGA